MTRSAQRFAIGALAALGLLAVLGFFFSRPSDPYVVDSNDKSQATKSDSDSHSDPNSESDSVASHAASSSLLAPVDTPLDLLPSVKERRYDATLRDILVLEDPVADGWDTERFSEVADKQLKLVGKLLSDASLIDGKHVANVGSKDFEGCIRPTELTSAFEDAIYTVMRSTDSIDSAEGLQRGLRGLEDALTSQASVLGGDGARRFKFKIVRVELEGNTAKTKSLFQIVSLGEEPVQVNSTWDCVWDTRDKSKPKLSSIAVSEYEEVHAKSNAGFVDVTRSLFAGNASLDEQFIYGRDHWYGNLEASIGVEGRGNGISIGDANGDGLEDIYLCQPAALPNRLFLRQADGTMKDASKDSGVDWLDSSRGALFVDIDNDGDQDLVVTQSSQVLVHENDGKGIFELRTTVPTISRLFSVNAIDYDNDGDLDLYVCGYSGTQQIRPEDIFASPVPYHDANNGAPNFLLRNDGDWKFEDVTKECGLDVNNLRFSLASTWDDFDQDGDLDVYVANDFGRNNLYRNDDGQFVDIAGVAGVEDIGPGMSASWGDYNNDGLPDIYVSNMFSSAGSRITHNSQFKPGAGEDDLTGFKRHARGNSLFENQGDGTFADLGVESGTMMGRWAWGSMLVDINNDGWRDAYVANGFVTADNNNDL